MKRLAIIPARGGSKRIPRKNLKEFFGKPVIVYSIEAALKSDLFDEVMVSTEDTEIAEVAREYGAKVPFMRSEKTADDFATTADVILEVIENYRQMGQEFDEICCIYATSPLLNTVRLQEAAKKMETANIDSIFTIVQYSYPPQRSLAISEDGKVYMRYPEYKTARSQDLEPIYHDAGQFYMSRTDYFLSCQSFWGENTGAIILPELEVQDLDTLTDWTLAEMKYKLLHG